jgi:hypothetical protein
VDLDLGSPTRVDPGEGPDSGNIPVEGVACRVAWQDLEGSNAWGIPDEGACRRDKAVVR